MPELPDVEIFARNLDKLFAGKKLQRIKIIGGKNFTDSAVTFTKRLKGKKLERIYRSGKEMRFQFSGDELMGLHLMLTGDVIVFDKKNDHHSTLAELFFEGGQGLALTDRMRNAHLKIDPVDKEGIDAISPQLNFKTLKKILDSKAKIKNVLTDQHVIRGIGNSYSDEILWQARISPFSVSNAIPEEKVKELAKLIKKVLKEEVKNIHKNYPGKVNGEVKDFMQIHTKAKTKSPTGATIIIEKKGMMKTYYTKEQKLYQ